MWKDLPCLNCCLLDFTTKKFWKLQNFKTKSSNERYFWDILILNNINRCKEDNSLFCFSGHILFVSRRNPNLISSLEKATKSLFFETTTEYCLSCLLFVMSYKRSSSVEMERENSFQNSRLKSTGIGSLQLRIHRNLYDSSSLGIR